MNPFERALRGDAGNIPLSAASSYLLELKSFPKQASALTKTAGWQDPPDTTGALEGKFSAPVENVVQLMGVVANRLLRVMNAGLIYANSVRGPMAKGVKCAIESCEWDHKHAFEWLVERMTVLLGPPHITEPDMAPSSTDPMEVCKRMIRAEQEILQSWQALLKLVGEESMMCVRVREHAASCQGHIDKYWVLLPQELQTTMTSAPAPEVVVAEEPPPALEAPPEEPPAEPLPKAASVKEARGSLEEDPRSAQEIVAELEQKGRESAITGAARAEHMARHQRGERFGGTLGNVAGTAAGAALGHGLGHTPVGTGLGMAGGYLLGGKLGKLVGEEADIRRHKLASVAARMVQRVKLAEDPALAMGASPEAPMSSPTSEPEAMPANYLQAEAIGQRMQNMAEVNYHKQVARKAMEQAQSQLQATQQQKEQLQQQTMMLQQEADQANQRIQQALQQAVQARDEALQQTEIAANLRMGVQQQRQKMMELASQDPTSMAADALGISMGQQTPQPPMEAQQGMTNQQGGVAPDAGGSPPGGGAGPAGEAPPPGGGAPPGSASGESPGGQGPTAQAGGPPGPPTETATPTTQLGTKEGSVKTSDPRLWGMGLGAAAGAGVGMASAYRDTSPFRLESLKARLEELQQTQDGSYAQAARVAKIKKSLAEAELAHQFPKHVALRRAAGGALSSALKGSVIGSGLQVLAR